jgi:hypothetical protein
MQDETKIVGGISYTISQSMVWRAERHPASPSIEKIKAIFALIACLPFLAVVAPIWYMLMLNKTLAKWVGSIVEPRLMPMMDKSFRKAKLELLKDVHGRVLDVGCGDGAWLRYLTKAAHVTELEPNPFLRTKIQANIATFQESNPNVEVEVVTKFVHELDPAKSYDAG